MLIEVASSYVVVTGTSKGNPLPRYEFSHGYGDDGPILEALEEMYCQGLYGTRSVGQRCTLVDVACFPYCASAYWANVDISEMSHLLMWIEMLHQRPSFSTGLAVPFSRPAFFGPPYATPDEIESEIARNAGQFAVISKSPS